MEKIEESLLVPPANQQVKMSLKRVVHEMHERDFVHGDLYSQNILVVGDTVCLLDIDWAGTYSFIKIPQGIEHFCKLPSWCVQWRHYKEHDLCQIQQICLDH